MMVAVIGRGHSGTRAISHTLSASGVYMGAQLNGSGDLIPAQDMYQACRVMARHVVHLGGNRWDFSAVHATDPEPEFVALVRSYLSSVLASSAEHRGWKLPETTLVYPWIVRMFPDVHYVHWVRDPRDCVLGRHLTDDLADFGVRYERTDDVYEQRIASWTYQQEIVRSTPAPKRTIRVRFEDFVLSQEATLERLEAFLGMGLARIPVKPEAVGRWRNPETRVSYSGLEPYLEALGYTSETA